MKKKLNIPEIKERVIRFYSRYGEELRQIASLLEIRLNQISLAYTLQNSLPKESIVIRSRIKTLESIFLKLKRMKWPQFYFLTEVVKDLIGARIVCWFMDDCYGLLSYLLQSEHFKIDRSKIKDYVKEPHTQGYRAIHFPVEISYDGVKRDKNGDLKIIKEEIICEIQIRTKLQDAWGDVTHEFYYKNKAYGIKSEEYEILLSSTADRLSLEDKDFIKFRKIYQELAAKSDKANTREGFKDES